MVGAGPGPLDLMTLRALDRLRRADVVVHDRLVSTEVLDQIPPQAQRVYVGKALGDHAVPQEGIHALTLPLDSVSHNRAHELACLASHSLSNCIGLT